MNVSDVRDIIIPLIKAHTGHPVIEADQGGEVPEGNHTVYKFIAPYIKEVGRPNVSHMDSASFNQIQKEDYRITLSITAVSEENDESLALAQILYDWFNFHGLDYLQAADIVPIAIGDIGNRDSVNDEETRQGFDVSFRINRELNRTMDYFDKVDFQRE